MRCRGCRTENRAGRRFCSECGSPLALTCPGCGAANEPGDKFCGECGSPLVDVASSGATSSVSERRLVAVLFADLVGFTTLSEHRDPEEVRELLSRYFDRCRTLIERFGGTVEKFIGDAVMAVWGTPVAREDDAERAVRAGLALTQAVSELSDELRVRVGILTGSAAVEVGAESEGMVLGDTVNTASRLQSIARAGTVLVDDVTKRASEAAIAYEDAGTHEVKGREQPVHAWTALRVVAGARGARRSVGLEAPFVGRNSELELIIEASEASASERRARMVTVVGDAGTGKSRLLWEFFKYVDGIEDLRWWHQGRCLSYGDGVAYWALAEMVRARAGILEEEDPKTAREKLTATVAEHVPDERERRLVEPRLAHLLGLEQRTAADRADLFSGWRLFFERLADSNPVTIAFEDLEWADSGLLDFIDYLLEWSADLPIFILALGRPELLTARPEWTATITLGPLGDETMNELLRGLVPGLPEELSTRIRHRAEGVPLYAVETVRMLLDRNLVQERGSRYVVCGDVSDLEVPETLHALAAARLDNLDQAERSLLQDAAVIGQSFTPATLIAVAERPAEDVQRVLAGLVAKQVLAFIDDPRSGERGQYVFLQALLRQVAIGMLSRRDRKAKHLAIARHLRETWGEDAGDIAEVLASHYQSAVEADPDADDAATIRASACDTLADAGRRALSLALGPEALRHFERAAELAQDPPARGRLLREAGMAAYLSGKLENAISLLSEAAALLRDHGLEREAARVDGLAGSALQEAGQLDEAAERLDRAYAAIDDGSDDEAMADLAQRRASTAFMRGDREESLRLADTALRIADRLRLGPTLVRALIDKANALAELGRPDESTALYTHSLELALEQDLAQDAVRAYYNLAETRMGEARFAEADELLERGLALTRQRGDRQSERRLLANQTHTLTALGRWDEAIALSAELRKQADDVWAAQTIVPLPHVLAARGDTDGLKALLEHTDAARDWAAVASAIRVARAVILRETGDAADSVEEARDATLSELKTGLSDLPWRFAEATECAFVAGRPEVVEELLAHVDTLTPSELIPLLEAEAARARARVAAHGGDASEAERWFRRATELFSKLATPFYLARAQLEFAELLAAQDGAEAEALRSNALQVFEDLRATPWADRARALSAAVAAA